MLNDLDCPAGVSSAGCEGPVTFELAGIRPEKIYCRAEVKELLENNPHYFAGLIPVDLALLEEDVVIDLRIRRAAKEAIAELQGSGSVGSTGPRLVHSI